MNELVVCRREGGSRGMWGELTLDGGPRFAYTLENHEKLIPAGHYKVELTESGRARRGSLWTPWPDARLPELVGIVGHAGVRIHAANVWTQLGDPSNPRSLSCLAVGLDRNQGELVHSRLALAAVKDKVAFPCWLIINDPPKKETTSWAS